MSPAILINELMTYVQEGGFVMPPLLLFACLLWYGLGERMLILRRGVSGDLTQVMKSGSRPSAGVLGDAWTRIRGEINVMLSADELTARAVSSSAESMTLISPRIRVQASPRTPALGREPLFITCVRSPDTPRLRISIRSPSPYQSKQAKSRRGGMTKPPSCT